MERKLSQKATRMRQRLTFSRNNQGRNRASTMNNSETASNAPSSRPRSSTTPDTSTPAEIAWDNADATRCYTFTDEPGYFRPPSPLIDRQLIEEDLEDNVKHACALLVQSVDRGVPIWPALHSEVRPKYSAEENKAHASTSETKPNGQQRPQHPFTHLLPPTAPDTAIRVCKSQHDSGVAMSVHSVGNPSKTNPTSLSASACHGRFYGKRQSTSPSAKESFDRGRARGHSFATDTSSLHSRTPSQSRSRSSSPALFPYSPPQLNAQWTPSNDHDPAPLDAPLPETKTAFLGVEGTTWLRASLDLPRPREHDPRMTSTPGTSTGPPASGPAPRRFYSTRQAPRKRTSEWPAPELDGSSRDSLAEYGGFSTDSLAQPPHDFPFRPWTGRDARPFQMAGVESHENVYSIVIPAEAGPRHRRKRASHLLKRLAGLGMRRKEGEVSEGRRVGRTVAVVG